MKRSFLEEQLKDLGLEDNVKKGIIDIIMKANGDDINAEKTKTESVQNDLKVKEGLIEELNKKIKELDSVDIEKIKQEQFDLGKAEGSKEFDNFKKTSALKSALSGYKAKDVELLQKMLDNEKIEYEEKDGNYSVKGIDDQIKEIKETHSYLFDEDDDKGQKINLGGTHSGKSGVDSDLEAVAKAMGLETENNK